MATRFSKLVVVAGAEVHDAHAAPAQLAQYPIGAEPLGQRRIVGRRRGRGHNARRGAG